ncbi:hypothetical protein FKM82_024652 [Ascaphus truei]
MDTLVVNLSDYTLNQCEMSVLARGPSYVPTTLFNDFDLEVDLFKFERVLNLKSFFSNRSTESVHSNIQPGTGNPPMNNKGQLIWPLTSKGQIIRLLIKKVQVCKITSRKDHIEPAIGELHGRFLARGYLPAYILLLC